MPEVSAAFTPAAPFRLGCQRLNRVLDHSLRRPSCRGSIAARPSSPRTPLRGPVPVASRRGPIAAIGCRMSQPTRLACLRSAYAAGPLRLVVRDVPCVTTSARPRLLRRGSPVATPLPSTSGTPASRPRLPCRWLHCGIRHAPHGRRPIYISAAARCGSITARIFKGVHEVHRDTRAMRELAWVSGAQGPPLRASVRECDDPGGQEPLITPAAPGGIARPYFPPRGYPCGTSRPGPGAQPRSEASYRRRR
jgi:hypothetical protein